MRKPVRVLYPNRFFLIGLLKNSPESVFLSPKIQETFAEPLLFVRESECLSSESPPFNAGIISDRNYNYNGVKNITIRVINVEIWDRIRMHVKLFTR